MNELATNPIAVVSELIGRQVPVWTRTPEIPGELPDSARDGLEPEVVQRSEQ